MPAQGGRQRWPSTSAPTVGTHLQCAASACIRATGDVLPSASCAELSLHQRTSANRARVSGEAHDGLPPPPPICLTRWVGAPAFPRRAESCASRQDGVGRRRRGGWPPLYWLDNGALRQGCGLAGVGARCRSAGWGRGRPAGLAATTPARNFAIVALKAPQPRSRPP